jgi:hypothetical protein
VLRLGNAGSNTDADHITVIHEALRQLPGHRPGTRPERKVLTRIDSAGCTHELLEWIVAKRLSYSVGFTLPDTILDELAIVPEHAWQPAHDADGGPARALGYSRSLPRRPGAAVRSRARRPTTRRRVGSVLPRPDQPVAAR